MCLSTGAPSRNEKSRAVFLMYLIWFSVSSIFKPGSFVSVVFGDLAETGI
jgi:hypothetical protein